MTVFWFQRDVGPDLRYEFTLDLGYDIYRYRIGLMMCKLDEQIKDSKMQANEYENISLTTRRGCPYWSWEANNRSGEN
jgi:hypothetical protein